MRRATTTASSGKSSDSFGSSIAPCSIIQASRAALTLGDDQEQERHVPGWEPPWCRAGALSPGANPTKAATRTQARGTAHTLRSIGARNAHGLVM
ncbi:hypothetical protein [Singulisphaera sp. PoT]|uniref:hypothetical protein n=1 Tax=Singulisphaera sp. PoT TaxID=3411797 RepID=UPI003BF5651F